MPGERRKAIEAGVVEELSEADMAERVFRETTPEQRLQLLYDALW